MLRTCFIELIMATFKKLVRFAAGAETHYGDLIGAVGNNYTVRKLKGSPFTNLETTEEIHETQTVCLDV